MAELKDPKFRNAFIEAVEIIEGPSMTSHEKKHLARRKKADKFWLWFAWMLLLLAFALAFGADQLGFTTVHASQKFYQIQEPQSTFCAKLSQPHAPVDFDLMPDIDRICNI